MLLPLPHAPQNRTIQTATAAAFTTNSTTFDTCIGGGTAADIDTGTADDMIPSTSDSSLETRVRNRTTHFGFKDVIRLLEHLQKVGQCDRLAGQACVLAAYISTPLPNTQGHDHTCVQLCY